MNPELLELASRIGAALTQPVGWPTPAPDANTTADQWRNEVEQLRAQHDAMALQGTRLSPAPPKPTADTQLSVEYASVPVGDRLSRAAKIYRPASETGPRPAVLFLHGGGWWMAGGAVNFELNDPLCRYLAAELGAAVVNFDYRLAPEHPYPTSLLDAEAAVSWLSSCADDLGIDPHALAVFGVSSGGNLAAALTRRLRGTDRALTLQLLLAPALNVNFDGGSDDITTERQELTARLRSYYLPNDVSADDPDVSPVRATDLEGLPPTAVVVGTLDPLRGDGVRYAENLAAAGTESVLLEYEMTHGVATSDVTASWLRDVTDFAAKRLGRAGVPGH